MSQPRIILAGGSGFLGRGLAEHFQKADYDVVILTRSPRQSASRIREVAWDARTLGDWSGELEGATSIINLTGRSVDCRYKAKNRKEILESRVYSTRLVGEAIVKCKGPPRVWLNSSTATIYKHVFDHAMDDTSHEMDPMAEAKDAFSVVVAQAWERALDEAHTPRTRKIALRCAMVLGTGKNSVFPVLRRMTRFGLGGTMGRGNQFVSWIHETDFCRAVEWLIAHDNFCGPVNVCSPNPLPNREMMELFRQVCGAPFGLPATEWMLEIGALLLRTETELIIKSRRVVPRHLIDSGFEFRLPLFRDAVRDLQEKMNDTRGHSAS